MKRKFSFWHLCRQALSPHSLNEPYWQDKQPKKHYDIIVIGGGGHGLATAYYLAKNHNLKNIAVLEKGYLGGGNTGRNTTIVRSNYLWDESSQLYEFSLKLWENLSQELNYNIMLSQRGVLNLGHTLQEIRDIRRRVNANRLNGIDAVFLTPEEIKRKVPIIDISPNARYPILGASYQPRAGTARHDAVAWGYARAADALGVDIIQQCEVVGIRQKDGAVVGVDTNRGPITTNKIAVVVAGHASVIAAQAGMRLPIESRPLQAFVSEPIKPILDTVVMSNAIHAYISQSSKGDLVIGAGVDRCIGYGQRGNFSVIEHATAAILELFPIFSRVRMNRHWGGIVDICPDACPIISKAPVKNLFFNCGWGTGGFKATPGSGYTFAHLVATNQPHPLASAFTLDRFTTGALIDEHGAAGVAH